MPAGVVSDGGIVICEAPADHLRSRQFWDDNALLLAASKGLLEALEGLERLCSNGLWRDKTGCPLELTPHVENARAAIAAATATEPARTEDA